MRYQPRLSRCIDPTIGARGGRVIPVLLEGITSSEILDYLDDRRLAGQIDAFYSIDAMVHVTLQHLITYLLTAAVCLRKDGMVLRTIPMRHPIRDSLLYSPTRSVAT